jgi:hypothetical protein
MEVGQGQNWGCRAKGGINNSRNSMVLWSLDVIWVLKCKAEVAWNIHTESMLNQAKTHTTSIQIERTYCDNKQYITTCIQDVI